MSELVETLKEENYKYENEQLRLDECLRQGQSAEGELKSEWERHLSKVLVEKENLRVKFNSLAFERDQLKSALQQAEDKLRQSDAVSQILSLRKDLENALSKIDALQIQLEKMDEKRLLELEKATEYAQQLAKYKQKLIETYKQQCEESTRIANSREGITHLQAPLDEAEVNKAQCSETVAVERHKIEGNSLFVEVNDHGVKAENQAVSLKRRFAELNRENAKLKRQLQDALNEAVNSASSKSDSQCSVVESTLRDMGKESEKVQNKLWRATSGDWAFDNSETFLKFLQHELAECKQELFAERLTKLTLENQLIEMQRSNTRLEQESAQMRALVFQLQFKQQEQIAEKPTPKQPKDVVKAMTSSSDRKNSRRPPRDAHDADKENVDPNARVADDKAPPPSLRRRGRVYNNFVRVD